MLTDNGDDPHADDLHPDEEQELVRASWDYGGPWPDDFDDAGAVGRPTHECLYCGDQDVAVRVPFGLQPGLRLAAPNSFGLCRTCTDLLGRGAFVEVLRRTGGRGFDAYLEEDVVALIAATAAALPQ